MSIQESLTLDVRPDRPDGFAYRPDFVDQAEERALVAELQRLQFNEVRMRGQVARRRTVHLGWLYGYEGRAIEPGPPIPPFLLPLRERAAALAGVAADDLGEVLITEYAPGAGIGWHRDAPMFDTVIGISLVSACRFRFRRSRQAARRDEGAAEDRDRQVWDTCEVALEPRSAYVLGGAARWAWQHSIPPMKTLRYSMTFRTLRADRST